MIRQCQRADFETMYEIINDAAQAYKGVIPLDRWHEPYMPRDELRREIDAGVAFWGHEEDGQLLGVMGIQDVQDVTLIRHAYVRTKRRQQGIGGQLLAHLRRQTSRPVLIGTWADATWAIHFYEKHGFQLVSKEEKNRLLKKYWSIPDRQVETSVVLAEARDLGGLHLRRALADDAPQLAQIHVDSWQAAYRGVVPDAFRQNFSYQRREAAFRQALESNAAETYLAREENGQPVGILTLGACRDPDLDVEAKQTGELWGIYLLPTHWRRGIGRKLVGWVESTLISRGYRDAVLWVLEDNQDARRFYKAMGFSPDGVSKQLNLGAPLKAIRYRKTVGR
jgi:GNAT superfamily N-acetyltransferase